MLSLLAVLLFGAGWLLGWLWYGKQLQALERGLKLAGGRISQLEAENHQLQMENVDLKQTAKVNQSTLQDMRKELSTLLTQLDRAHGELEFFSNLMDESAQHSGLDVHELRVLPTSSPRVFAYELVLRQGLKKAKEQQGTYWLTLEGAQQGQSRQLRIPKDGQGLPYRFKYFQRLNGQLDLPQGFEPLRVTVHLKPKEAGRNTGQKKPSVLETTLAWKPETPEGNTDVQERE